jgi:formate dehydrogenase major subunit
MQWRYKAADGPGEAEDDLWMLDQITKRLKALYSAEGGPSAESITMLDWNYGADHPDVHAVAKEINGYDLTTNKLAASFSALKADGTTTSGNWLYCNSYVEPDAEPDAPIPGNRASRRNLDDAPFNIGLHPKWAWCWPVNRRIIYNRASVDLDGNPWDTEQPVIKWNPTKGDSGGWDGDVPDGGAPPMNQGGYYPFIMKAEGHSRFFGPGMAEGPLPEHYEPKRL